jgi:hypothetical protein
VGREVRIAADDKCAGIDAPDGRTYHFKDHYATVPESVANGLRQAGVPHIGKAMPVGIGWSAAYEDAWDRIFGQKKKGDSNEAHPSGGGNCEP